MIILTQDGYIGKGKELCVIFCNNALGGTMLGCLP